MALVKFKDVVVRANTKEDRFNTDKIYYVGGEHIESNEVTIKGRGLIEGSTIGPMFYFGFKAGQVLFVTRNPHLRKAGWVDFDGICSEKTFVLETKDENVLCQRFLPFLMQSDHFWNYCEANKSGSVNFFINWSTLAKYEFDLPDIQTQRKLADLLWAIERTKQAYKQLISATDELVKSQFIEMFGNPLLNEKKWAVEKMINIAPSTSYKGKIDSVDGKYWLLNLDMIESNTGNIIDKEYVLEDEIGQSTSAFSSEYVLYSKLRPYLNKVVVPDGTGFATTELVTLLPKKNYITQVFLSYLLRGNEFLDHISSKVSGTKMPRVTMSEFWNFEVILPPIELQEQFAAFVRQTDKSKFELTQALEALNATYKKLISENLG